MYLPAPKRFISKVEVIAGAGLAFNYGNKFIENYKDENVKNKRLLKVGYTFGLGIYHPVSKAIDVNVRLQYEQKGTKNELNTPTQYERELDLNDYSYKYLTISIAPQISIGHKRNWVFSIGGYYSKIKGISGYSRTYHTLSQYKNDGHFKGRFFKDLRNDGGVYSITWIPGLRSFETYDFGATLAFGRTLFVKGEKRLTIQLLDQLGLKNINKNNPYNLEEKNHTVSLIMGYTLKIPNKNNH